jgi:hypothetical protein
MNAFKKRLFDDYQVWRSEIIYTNDGDRYM